MSDDALKVPPHSIEAEQSVIGGLMLDNEAWNLIQHQLAAADFYRHNHRLIFDAIVSLLTAGSPADVVTVAEFLDDTGRLEGVGGLPYLMALTENTPTAANITTYAAIVADRSRHREAIRAASSLLGKLWKPDGATTADVIDSGVRDLMALSVRGRNYEHSISEVLSATLDEVEAVQDGRIKYISTGLIDLDGLIGGWRGGDVYYIGARPKVGKTAFLIGSMIRGGAGGGLISSEQGAVQIGMRWISQAGQVDAGRLRTAKLKDSDWPLITSAISRLRSMPIWVYDKSGPTIAEVERWARKMKHEHNIPALYLDYVQRIRPDERSERMKRYEQIDDICKRLKDLARDLDIPVVALAQVKREVEARVNKRPMMGDFSDGSSIEKEADCAMTLYRDEVYDEQTSQKGVAEVYVCANRHGPAGTVLCDWMGQFMTFENYSGEVNRA